MNNEIVTYSLNELDGLVAQCDQKMFRVKQLRHWLYCSGAQSYDEMSNLPAPFRMKLQEIAPFHFAETVDRRVSKDGTRKYLLKFSDGSIVETVAIPSKSTDKSGESTRLTVCVSSQVGCPMACSFCATGLEGFTRNLYPGEVVQQILVVQKDFGARVSNVVVMGQGEPFLNYDNVLAALRIMNHPDCLAIGARHITLSSCGIVDGIHRLAAEPEQFTFALSLHSAIQSTRDQLMPKCKKVLLTTLKDTLIDYNTTSGRRVSLEYLLIVGYNDSDKHLSALIAFCRGLSCHVNLLAMNHVEGSPYKATPAATIQKWQASLTKAGIETSRRDSRGSDIDGACGQLKNSR